MKLFAAAVVFLAASLATAIAQNEPLEPMPPKPPMVPASVLAVLSPLAPGQEMKTFSSVAPTDPIVRDVVNRFETLYAEEMSRSSLLANVSSILKAERTSVRGEMIEKQRDSGGLGIDFVEETQSQQYRIFLLMKYQFDSAMLGRNRPHVTVLRLTMDCYNVSSETVDADAAPDEQAEYDTTPASPVRLACDVLEHTDLPRRNESITSIPAYIQRQIYHSAPTTYIHNHSLHVFYDAVEAQDLAFDAKGKALVDRDTMHYVRFRVQGGNAKDCVVAIEHTRGINTLRYQDSVCFESADADAAIAAAVKKTSDSPFSLTGANAPVFVLIASVVGAGVAMLLMRRQRQRQRSGYSYLSSSTSKLSTVPSQGTTNTDAAVAC